MPHPEERLQRAADIALVQDLIARLAHEADHGELPDYLALFTEDARWVMPPNPDLGLVAQTRTGHAEIGEGAEERRSAGVVGPGTHTRHVVTSTAVTPDGDKATAVSYYRFYVDTAARPKLVTMGVYRDTFALRDGQWLLAERLIEKG